MARFNLAGGRQIRAQASSRRYHAVIDTQGLFLKSALLARAARGRRHGYDPNSIKEPFAVQVL
jgi:heptosyltransferase-1